MGKAIYRAFQIPGGRLCGAGSDYVNKYSKNGAAPDEPLRVFQR